MSKKIKEPRGCAHIQRDQKTAKWDTKSENDAIVLKHCKKIKKPNKKLYICGKTP